MEKRKPTYQQALALEKAQQARRNNLRRTPQTQTDVERDKWNADRKAALAAYRAKRERNA